MLETQCSSRMSFRAINFGISIKIREMWENMDRLAMIFALDYKYGGWTQLLCSKHTHMTTLAYLIVPTENLSVWLRVGPENLLF